jgi:hypothetical protein
MRRTSALWALLFLSLFASACDSGDADPTESELFGIWGNLDAGQWRVFEFSESSTEYPELVGRTPVYTVSLYADGASRTVVQRGIYAVKFGRLVTTVLFDTTAANIGRDFGNDISEVSAGSFKLQSTSSATGSRVFERLSAFP